MILGFHTVSLLLHDETTVATEVAALGYRCVAIRPRLGGLDPNQDRFVEKLLRFGEHARSNDLTIVIDTEGEFIHDPHVARGPSLCSDHADEGAAAESWIRRWVE